MTIESTDDVYPKTLHIRNIVGDMIWQIYHVQRKVEAERLSVNAQRNGFLSQTLVDHTDEEETFPNWREEAPSITAD